MISNLRLINLASKHSNVQAPHNTQWLYLTTALLDAWRVIDELTCTGWDFHCGSFEGSWVCRRVWPAVSDGMLPGSDSLSHTIGWQPSTLPFPSTICPQSSCDGGLPSWRDSKPTHGEGEREMGQRDLNTLTYWQTHADNTLNTPTFCHSHAHTLPSQNTRHLPPLLAVNGRGARASRRFSQRPYSPAWVS